MKRERRIREIIEHLRALASELDDTEHKCDACGLNVKHVWTEANAKTRLTEGRKKFEKMLGEAWVQGGEMMRELSDANPQIRIYADALARLGYSPREILEQMRMWSDEATARAVEWAEREDARMEESCSKR